MWTNSGSGGALSLGNDKESWQNCHIGINVMMMKSREEIMKRKEERTEDRKCRQEGKTGLPKMKWHLLTRSGKNVFFPGKIVTFPTISYVFLYWKYKISHQMVTFPWKELPDFHIFPPCLLTSWQYGSQDLKKLCTKSSPFEGKCSNFYFNSQTKTWHSEVDSWDLRYLKL